MKISFSDNLDGKSDSIVFLVTEDLNYSGKLAEFDKKTSGAIKKSIEVRDFKGKKNEILTIVAPSNIDYNQIILIGLGKADEINDVTAQNAGGTICGVLNSTKSKQADIVTDNQESTVAANFAFGANLRAYRFSKYKTNEKPEKLPTLKNINIVTSETQATTLYASLEKVAEGVFLSRDVVTEPPNKLYPESYAKIIDYELSGLGVNVKILKEKELENLGMGSLLGVGQGSARESHVVVMEYNGSFDKQEQPIAFIGKGVTFDTGGISLKPSGGMEDMKYDMGGSGVVVGLMKALAGRKAKVNAVGIVGLVENMPGDNAQRPSDVVTSMSGQTIEVLNTDAEGRLVLADILTYIQKEHNPKIMIDLATLTGAIVVALGSEHAGLFSNNDDLSAKLLQSGLDTDEKLWRFPLMKAYDKLLDSPIADMQNISAGRGAGSITAAQFLQRFVENDTPWAHLDIAGVTWDKEGKAISPKGATAFGVRLLNKLVADNYED